MLKIKWLHYLVRFIDQKFPAEILVTRHAQDRIQVRLGTKRHKLRRLVYKAWESQDIIPVKFTKQIRKRKKRIYRFFMGCVFIFNVRYLKGGFEQKILITVINPNIHDYQDEMMNLIQTG